jgi:hypothetical protein
LRNLAGRDPLAVPTGQGCVVDLCEPLEQLLGEDALGIAPEEDRATVAKQANAEGVILARLFGREDKRRSPCPLRPLAAGAIGDRKQWLPDIGRPVAELLG